MKHTRYSAFWHDGSLIGNDSQFLIILSKEEYYLKYKKYINVQATTEELQLYLLARCASNNQQIVYPEETITNLFKIQKPF